MVAVALPFLAFLLALVLLWNHGVDALDLELFAGMYLAAGLGVSEAAAVASDRDGHLRVV